MLSLLCCVEDGRGQEDGTLLSGHGQVRQGQSSVALPSPPRRSSDLSSSSAFSLRVCRKSSPRRRLLSLPGRAEKEVSSRRMRLSIEICFRFFVRIPICHFPPPRVQPTVGAAWLIGSRLFCPFQSAWTRQSEPTLPKTSPKARSSPTRKSGLRSARSCSLASRPQGMPEFIFYSQPSSRLVEFLISS
jgi:hypothetical protein